MVVGGLRRRLIKDNFYYMVHGALSDLNWFDSPAAHKPVTILTEQVDPLTEITPNKVVVSAEELLSSEWEMGSTLDEYRWDIYIDIFAEDESVGIHLSGDIYDILRGKIASVGRSDSNFPVYDLRDDNDTVLFNCDIENVEIARVREWTKPFNKYWWVVGCTLVDYYHGEGG